MCASPKLALCRRASRSLLRRLRLGLQQRVGEKGLMDMGERPGARSRRSLRSRRLRGVEGDESRTIVRSKSRAM